MKICRRRCLRAAPATFHGAVDLVVADHDPILILGRKSTTYSAPR
jgi:hypothetical protein